MMQLSQFSEYWDTAKRVAQRNSASKLWVLIRIIYCRLVHGIGPQDFVLYAFYSKSWSAPKNYMMKHELEAIQRQVNAKAICDLVDDKLEYYFVCQQQGIPTPKILALMDFDKKEEEYKGIPFINTSSELLNEIQTNGVGKYILKKVAGSHGAGIMRLTFNGKSVIDDQGNPINLEQLFAKLIENNASYILQKSLLAHSALRKIMPGVGLGTVRIVTMNVGGEVRIFSACVRIPVGLNIADNFLHGKAKNLIANVDLETWRLWKPYGPDPLGLDLVENVELHPDNGERIEGFEFPFWQDMLDTVINGAKAFSELRTIGWDVALTEDGPSLIEANWRYDCDILQVALNKGLKSIFKKELLSGA